MKWYKPENIVERNDAVISSDEYYNVVHPVFDWEKERNRVIGRISK